MTCSRLFCRVLAMLLLLSRGVLADVNGTDKPAITSMELSGTNLVVHAHVPSGFRNLTLESRSRLGHGTWSPRAVQSLNGAAGDVSFTVSRSAEIEIMRLRVDVQQPLPASFYNGVSNFSGAPTNVVNSTTPAGVTAPTGGVTSPNTVTTGDSTRDVVESDIWKVSGDTLYFFNQWRGLQVIDISNPDAPALRGSLELPASGEQMYLRATNQVVLLARAGASIGANGNDSRALLVDTSGNVPVVVSNLSIAGWIQDSRLVGTALYVVSETYRPVAGTTDAWEWGSLVSAFDLSNFNAPVARGTLWLPGYGNVVVATDRFLFVANQDTSSWWRSSVNVVDISSPDGSMRSLSTIRTAGTIRDKFKLNLNGDTFTAISENWNNVSLVTQLENFSLANASSPKRVGALSFAAGEVLQATRFDGNRVYVATGVYTDPLTIVDNSSPPNPRIAGTVDVPGYSTFIQPMGTRLVTLGVVSNRVALSLFDVSGTPALLSRVLLGENYSWSEANWDEKAFSVLPDVGLILVPYEGYATNGYSSQVQLVDLSTNTLALRGKITQNMTPRRVTSFRDRILSLSGWDLLDVDATDRDQPRVVADLELAWPVDRVFLQGSHLIEVTTGGGWGYPSAPALHVASGTTPNRALNKLVLTNLPVIGATMRDGHLYLAQAAAQYYPFPYLTAGSADDTAPIKATDFVLTVIDLGDLPRLSVLGQTNIATSPFGWGPRLDALWPRNGLLVWASQSSYWPIMYNGAGVATPAAGGAVVGVGASSILPWPYYGSPGERLLAFDVSVPAAPAFQSEITVNRTNSWNFSGAFATNGLIYFSHHATEFIVYTGPTPTNVTLVSAGTTANLAPGNGGVIPLPSPGFWTQRDYLDVVDFGDATTPTVREPVNIPGALQGIGRNGALLYTVGGHWTATDWWNWSEFLDASAYDGVSAHLVDSLALSNTWPHPVLAMDATIFVGCPNDSGTTNGPPPSIETWTLNDTGHFAKLGSVAVTSSADTLVSVPGLLAAHESDGLIGVFDQGNPAALLKLNEVLPPGWVWPDLTGADGAAGSGLWIPLGGYGVMKILLGQ